MHDKFGREIKAGDLVLVPCVVRETYQTDEYCNVKVSTTEPMFPGNERTTMTLNTRQVVKGAVE